MTVLRLICLVCTAAITLTAATTAFGSTPRHRSHTKWVCHRVHHRRHCTRAKKKPAHGPATTPKPTSLINLAGTISSPTQLPQSSVAPSTGDGTSSTTPSPPVESTTPVAPAHVQVTAEDSEAFRFVLSRPTVPAGKVIIEFVNHGQDEHNLNAVEPSEGTVEGSIPNTAPNAHPTLTLNLRPGSYTLFCSLPEHEAKGMKATLTVSAT